MSRVPAAAAALRRRVADFVAGRDLLRPGQRTLLMLSGGADSMALLDLVLQVDRRLGLQLRLTALHVDYATRGEASRRDRRIVEDACEAHGVPLHAVRLRGKLSGPDFQERARRIRYDAAADLVRRGEADVIVTAHNRDDQAETVLYRLAKYATPGSLAGMPVAAGDVVRPLLCLGAGEIRAYCDALGIAFGVDESNLTADYARNLVRLEVLPVLARINPSVAETLACLAEVAGAEREVLDAALDDAWRRVTVACDEGEGGVAVDLGALAAQAGALRALCLRRLLRPAYGDAALIGRRVTAAVERLAADTAGNHAIALRDGFEAAREYDRLLVRRGGAPPGPPPAALAPGSVAVFCGRRFRADLLDGAHVSRDPSHAFLAVDDRPAEIVLRHPRRGDRFRPLGMPDEVLLSRFLSAAKVSRRLRGRAVVAEIDGRIVWVSPGRISESYRVSSATPRTLHLYEENA